MRGYILQCHQAEVVAFSFFAERREILVFPEILAGKDWRVQEKIVDAALLNESEPFFAQFIELAQTDPHRQPGETEGLANEFGGGFHASNYGAGALA